MTAASPVGYAASNVSDVAADSRNIITVISTRLCC